MLPDVLTELDLLAPMPDPELLLADFDTPRGTQDPTLLNFGTSQLLSESVEQQRNLDEPLPMDDDEFYIDIGDTDDFSIERGRNAPAGRTLADEEDESALKFGDGDDVIIDIGEGNADDTTIGLPLPHDDAMDLDHGLNTDGVLQPEDEGFHAPASPQRNNATPRQGDRQDDLEASYQVNDTTLDEPSEEFIQQAQRAKRRRVLQADTDTELHSSQIRAQQNDRSKILKPASFLPKDPVLLALMNMQKNGGFVSNVLGDGRNRGWAPELRGVLSIEVVRGAGDLKRKRDSGVADLGLSDEDQARSDGEKTPQLDLGRDDTALDAGIGAFDVGGDTTLGGAADIEDMPAVAGREENEIQDDAPPVDEPDNFDDTTMPLLHPEDAGPVSQGTKHAVHVLRNHFSPSDPTTAPSPDKRQKQTVTFQQLLPEARTSKVDATKMFFEVLVLATKDAIAVERQGTEQLGGPIKIRAKRGLWGAWAEAGTDSSTQNDGVAEVEVES